MATKTLNPKGGRPTAKQLQQLEQLHEQAYELFQIHRSYREIGRILGVTHKTAREYVSKHDAWLAVVNGNDSELRRFNHATLDICIARLMRFIDTSNDTEMVVKATATVDKLIRTQNVLLGLNKPVSVQVEHSLNVVPWGSSVEGRQAVYDLGVSGTSLIMDA